MTQSLVVLVRTTNSMEVSMVSIERITDYIFKKKEVNIHHINLYVNGCPKGGCHLHGLNGI